MEDQTAEVRGSRRGGHLSENRRPDPEQDALIYGENHLLNCLDFYHTPLDSNECQCKSRQLKKTIWWQIKQLKAGVHVVVGTPGRIEDLIQAGKLSCKRVRHFVLDEVKSPFSSPLICTSGRRNPVTRRTNQGSLHRGFAT